MRASDPSADTATECRGYKEGLHFAPPGGIAASLQLGSPPFPAVFFDRDGTLMKDVDYCRDPAQVAVYPDAAGSLRRLRAHGFCTVLVTNQSGIGRGYFTEDDYQRVHAELLRQLGGDVLDAAYHCPDHPDHPTERRKPGWGMILEASVEHPIDLARSYMVGDNDRDIESGRRAGLAANVLVLTGKGRAHLARCQPDFAAETLSDAVDWILRHAESTNHG